MQVTGLSAIMKWVTSVLMIVSMILSLAVPGTPSTPEKPTDTPTKPVAPVVREIGANTKNVILLIGDGMGMNHLEKTKLDRGVELVMETMPLKGQSDTSSWLGFTTDSAAGATALSCGTLTMNGVLGRYPTDINGRASYPMSITEYAKSLGMKTGVVTTDSTAGATPAGFSAHTSSRKNSDDISAQQIKANIDLIWGAATSSMDPTEVAKAGKKYISTKTELNALTVEDGQSIGQFVGDTWSTEAPSTVVKLHEMTEKALELLDNDNGFFVMIEGAHIDKHSHKNIDDKMTDALLEFDKAIEVALEFAKNDGNTVVIVTADHETGGITYRNGSYVFTVGSHTDADVPLLVYGNCPFMKDGLAVKNVYIASMMAALLNGGNLNILPSKVYVK